MGVVIMRRFQLICILIICLFPAFSQDNKSQLINSLIKDSLSINFQMIKNESNSLTETEKYKLYIDNKNDGRIPAGINILYGFGIGSFIYKDYLGGSISLGGALVGFGVMATGTWIYLINQDNMTGGITFLGGILILIGTKIYEGINPFYFEKKYNSMLKDALNIDKVVINNLGNKTELSFHIST
jgi:hypothetical protein